MIECIGSLDKNEIRVEIILDSVEIGHIRVNLIQWDRLREHRREGGPTESMGLQIFVEAEGAE